MMKTFIFLMLLALCEVHCNVNCNVNCNGDIQTKEKDTTLNDGCIARVLNFFCSNCLKTEPRKPIDCSDILKMGYNKSGIYKIWPINRLTERKYVTVYCDMDTNGGGWTVIQRRGNFNTPKDYFYRDWENYKEGFGDINEDFWLGNDNIYAITNQKLYSVRFDLKDFDQTQRYALYDKFWLEDEKNKYTLHISGYTGDAGDAMWYHNKQIFLTYNDDLPGKCANQFKGGWWYYDCDHYANLNGLYYNRSISANDTISWYKWKSRWSLERTEIKIRPKFYRDD